MSRVFCPVVDSVGGAIKSRSDQFLSLQGWAIWFFLEIHLGTKASRQDAKYSGAQGAAEQNEALSVSLTGVHASDWASFNVWLRISLYFPDLIIRSLNDSICTTGCRLNVLFVALFTLQTYGCTLAPQTSLGEEPSQHGGCYLRDCQSDSLLVLQAEPRGSWDVKMLYVFILKVSHRPHQMKSEDILKIKRSYINPDGGFPLNLHNWGAKKDTPKWFKNCFIFTAFNLCFTVFFPSLVLV